MKMDFLRLSLDDVDTVLVDSHTLSYYNIEDGCKLIVSTSEYSEYGQLSLTALDSINKTTLEGLQLGCSIAAIKEIVERKTGLSQVEQRLHFGKNNLEDDSTLSQNGIKWGSSLILTHKGGMRGGGEGEDPASTFVVRVASDPEHKLIMKFVLKWTSGYALKSNIELREGINKDEQILTFENKELLDDAKSLSYYGVQEGSIIETKPRRLFCVIFEEKNGRQYPCPVLSNNTTKELKKKFLELKEQENAGMITLRLLKNITVRQLPGMALPLIWKKCMGGSCGPVACTR